MTTPFLRGALTAAACAAALLAAAPALAQSADLKGKTITVYIGYGPGGGYDLYGRLYARHAGKHIPGNPTVIASNMPGAGSLKAANYLYGVAPKDGTALGIITQTVALEEALGTPGVTYKAPEFNFIGRLTSNVEMSFTWHTSKVKTIQDAYKIEVPVAGTGPGSAAEVYPKVLNGVLGTKFKVITGYPGSTEGMLAMERGETDGALTSWNTLKTIKKEWLDQKKLNLLVQYALQKHPDLPNVPTASELAKTEEERQVLNLYVSGADVGRSIVAPPKLQPAQVKMLRDAFDAMVADATFLAEIEKSKSEFDPLPGEKLQKIIVDSVAIPPAVLERAKEARGL
ncbi:MAG: Bug family tripartite tricarboxylate transporter substrate binding protein [Alphaproteobacteria bacterium]